MRMRLFLIFHLEKCFICSYILQDLIEKYQRSVNVMVTIHSQDNFYLTGNRNLGFFAIYMDLSLGFV